MNEKLNITPPHPPTIPEDVFVNADNTFSMKTGGTGITDAG